MVPWAVAGPLNTAAMASVTVPNKNVLRAVISFSPWFIVAGFFRPRLPAVTARRPALCGSAQEYTQFRCIVLLTAALFINQYLARPATSIRRLREPQAARHRQGLRMDTGELYGPAVTGRRLRNKRRHHAPGIGT